jgi:hypothetical protein
MQCTALLVGLQGAAPDAADDLNEDAPQDREAVQGRLGGLPTALEEVWAHHHGIISCHGCPSTCSCLLLQVSDSDCQPLVIPMQHLLAMLDASLPGAGRFRAKANQEVAWETFERQYWPHLDSTARRGLSAAILWSEIQVLRCRRCLLSFFSFCSFPSPFPPGRPLSPCACHNS